MFVTILILLIFYQSVLIFRYTAVSQCEIIFMHMGNNVKLKCQFSTVISAHETIDKQPY